MNIKQTAKILRVHTNTVYNMISEGRIRGSKTKSGSWDISHDEIDRILKEQTENPDMLIRSNQLIEIYEIVNDIQEKLNLIKSVLKIDEGDKNE